MAIKVDYSRLPSYMREGARRWIENGIFPGSFMQACIENDLYQAAMRTDQTNLRALAENALFWQFDAPEACRGSREALRYWNKVGGLEGLGKATGQDKDRVKDLEGKEISK